MLIWLGHHTKHVACLGSLQPVEGVGLIAARGNLGLLNNNHYGEAILESLNCSFCSINLCFVGGTN